MHARVAIPGELTTAALLVGLFTGGLRHSVVMPFDPHHARGGGGRGGCGCHNPRGTFHLWVIRAASLNRFGRVVGRDHRAPCPAGRGLPYPGPSTGRCRPRSSRPYVRASSTPGPIAKRQWRTVRCHSQEMDPAVRRGHVDLYVNDFTLAYGEEGVHAIRRLLEAASCLGVVPTSEKGLFWDE